MDGREQLLSVLRRCHVWSQVRHRFSRVSLRQSPNVYSIPREREREGGTPTLFPHYFRCSPLNFFYPSNLTLEPHLLRSQLHHPEGKRVWFRPRNSSLLQENGRRHHTHELTCDKAI